MPILAEVGDKVTAVGAIWLMSLAVSLVALLASAWRRRAVLVVMPLIGLWAVVVTSEVRDPYVGPAIAVELGRGYVTQAYVAAMTPFLFVGIGLLLRRRRLAV